MTDAESQLILKSMLIKICTESQAVFAGKLVVRYFEPKQEARLMGYRPFFYIVEVKRVFLLGFIPVKQECNLLAVEAGLYEEGGLKIVNAGLLDMRLYRIVEHELHTYTNKIGATGFNLVKHFIHQ